MIGLDVISAFKFIALANVLSLQGDLNRQTIKSRPYVPRDVN